MEYCGIFYEYINFDPSSPFNQLRFSPWYDAILVGGSYMAHPWGVVMRPTLYILITEMVLAVIRNIFYIIFWLNNLSI